MVAQTVDRVRESGIKVSDLKQIAGGRLYLLKVVVKDLGLDGIAIHVVGKCYVRASVVCFVEISRDQRGLE